MIFSSQSQPRYTAALIILAALIGAPASAVAASPAPSCSLIAITAQGLTEIEREATLSVEEGDLVGIAWIGKGAEKASTRGGKAIEPIGIMTMTAQETETYEFVFSAGSKKASCAVTLQVGDVAVDAKKLASSSATPTITGTASGIDTLYLEVVREGENKSAYTSKAIQVKKGKWSAKVTKKLKDGTYTLTLRSGKSRSSDVLVTETLTIGKASDKKDTKKSSSSSSTVFVEAIPLLLGGQLRAGATVPVSYLQLINLGKSPLDIEGFTLKQNGSASTDALVNLTVIDDAGNMIGSQEKGGTAFKKNIASVDADLTLAAGESRLVTIKAQAGPNLGRYLGTQLKLDVTAVETNGSTKGSFPIRGTMWTFGL